jgi:hypothetical protein
MTLLSPLIAIYISIAQPGNALASRFWNKLTSSNATMGDKSIGMGKTLDNTERIGARMGSVISTRILVHGSLPTG